MDNQNWDTITITRPRANPSAPKPVVERSAAALRRVEQAEVGKLKALTTESRNEIVQKRMALAKNQLQLNQDCRFPIHTIRDIENGKLCPTPAQLTMLNRVLKASLKYA